MAIDTSLAARIRQRLEDDKEQEIPANDFRVVSESTSNPLLSSIRNVIGGASQSKPAGLVKSVVKSAPKAIASGVSNYLKSEEEKRSKMTLGEQAVYDLVEKPAKILKTVGVDFPRMILGGLSSVGKTALEAIYSPVFGKEETRAALKGDPKVEQLLFAGETKSWQEVKEDIDAYTQSSPIATDWEKRNLGLTLALGGFVADVIPSGGGKGKIATKTLTELVEATDTAVVREIMTNSKFPSLLIDDAAEAVAKAASRGDVEKVLKQSASRLLKQAEATAPRVADDIAERVVPKEFAALADEARRYDSADEFVEAIVKDTGGVGSGVRYAPAKRLVETDINDTPLTNFGFKPEDTVTIYRGVDNAAQKEIAAGDYVATSRELAETYTGGQVISKEVPASSVRFSSGDGISADDFKEGFNNAHLEGVYNPTPPMSQQQLKDFYTAAKNDGMVQSSLPKLSEADIAVLKTIDNAPVFKAPSEKPKKATPADIAEYRDERGKIAQMRDGLIEQVQDEMIRVRRLVENPKLKVSDASNPYDAEIAFHGRVGHRLEQVRDTARAIDRDVIKTAKAANVPDAQLTKEVNEYLIARHAPERNAALGDGAAGIKTAEATARMAELEKLPYAGDLKRIAGEIQKMNNSTLDILKEGEVITDELYDTLRNKYKNHVPLYRVMAEEDDFAGSLGKGFDVKGTGIKTAKGSEREVMDVLGNVVFNNEQAIIRAEKNRVDLSTLKLIRDNKEVLKDLFKVRRPKVVGQTFSGKPITEVITDPQTLVMREKGKTTLIEIKDPQLALALRGVGRDKVSGMMRGVAAVSRMYSGIHTRFNPEFAFSNKIRDIQEVLVYTAAQGEVGAKGTAKVAAREARLENIRSVTDFIRGKDSEGARLYKQMMEDGGTTGGMGLSTRKQVEIDITEIRKLNRSNPRKAAQKTLELVDQWNTIFEDSSRLSVYRTAIENGASRQRAAVLAKESSVNFNKFGRQGQIINALYIFANASIQGTTKTIRAMKNPKVAATVTTGVFASVYAVSEWNDQIDPDWRNKMTTWDRLNSLAVMLPSDEGEGVKYITIPVAWGIKPIKVMADQFVDLTSGNSEGIVDATGAVLTSILEAYNPVGGSDVISAVTPTILDIPFEVARNQAWSGAAIKPDWDRNAPASIQYFASLRDSTTGRMAVGLSKGLSGIGIEISPADIHYSYEQLIGGAGRAVNKTVNTLAAIGGGTLPEAKDVPIVSRFYKTRPDEEVGAGASEFEQISNVLEEQSRERFYLSQKAEDSLQQLDSVPKEEAAAIFNQIKEADPDLAKKIVELKKEKDKGLTFIDRKILQLGVGNGERAKFLVEKFNSLETDEERANLWKEYKAKGIISDNVAKQIKALLKEQQ